MAWAILVLQIIPLTDLTDMFLLHALRYVRRNGSHTNSANKSSRYIKYDKCGHLTNVFKYAALCFNRYVDCVCSTLHRHTFVLSFPVFPYTRNWLFRLYKVCPVATIRKARMCLVSKSEHMNWRALHLVLPPLSWPFLEKHFQWFTACRFTVQVTENLCPVLLRTSKIHCIGSA